MDGRIPSLPSTFVFVFVASLLLFSSRRDARRALSSDSLARAIRSVRAQVNSALVGDGSSLAPKPHGGGGGGGWKDSRRSFDHGGGGRSSKWREDERGGPDLGRRGWKESASGPPPPGMGGGDFAKEGRGQWNRRGGQGAGWNQGGGGGGARTSPGTSPTDGPGMHSALNGPRWSGNDGGGGKKEPSRPAAGRGFSMGRGRGLSFGGGGGAGGSIPGAGASSSEFFEGFNKRARGRYDDAAAPPATSLLVPPGGPGPGGGGLTSVPAPATIERHGPVRYKYNATDLIERMRALEAACGGAGLPLPPNVDPESVPLRVVKPGDVMYELTVEGSKGSRARDWSSGAAGAAHPAPLIPPASAAAAAAATKKNSKNDSNDNAIYPGVGGVVGLGSEADRANVPEWATETAAYPPGAFYTLVPIRPVGVVNADP